MTLTDHLSKLFMISFFKKMIQNQVSSDTTTVFGKFIFGELILEKVREKQRTPSYHFFVKQSEIDPVHT